MTRVSSNFSARTTKPEGRKGRRPTTVRISRSGATCTGSKGRPLKVGKSGGLIDETRRGAQPVNKPATPTAAAVCMLESRNALRSIFICLWRQYIRQPWLGDLSFRDACLDHFLNQSGRHWLV